MSMSYIFKKNGKNSKLTYYLNGFMFYMTPRALLRRKLKQVLRSLDARQDKDYILDRVNYYNKLDKPVILPQSALMVGEHKLKGNKSVYFFDTFEFTRWFAPGLNWCYLFGDIIHVPDYPSIVKSRPLSDDNANSIVLNLDKVRHFCFVDDKTEFKDKRDVVIFRGDAYNKPRRQQFIAMYKDHPMCDIADVDPRLPDAGKYMMTLYQHLDYKFIMALEGNDVASNLKWVMSSNSIAVMPRPTCETWFMEGRLMPDYHYIEIKPDYSDLIERVTYYAEHPQEAQRIIDNAHNYVSQFFDKRRERLISLLVLDKYFRYTNDEIYL